MKVLKKIRTGENYRKKIFMYPLWIEKIEILKMFGNEMASGSLSVYDDIDDYEFLLKSIFRLYNYRDYTGSKD